MSYTAAVGASPTLKKPWLFVEKINKTHNCIFWQMSYKLFASLSFTNVFPSSFQSNKKSSYLEGLLMKTQKDKMVSVKYKTS